MNKHHNQTSKLSWGVCRRRVVSTGSTTENGLLNHRTGGVLIMSCETWKTVTEELTLR